MTGVPSCDDASSALEVNWECLRTGEDRSAVDSTVATVRMCKTQNLQSDDKRQEKNGEKVI